MSLRQESYKVACYNVLADCWVKPCKPMFLGCWETRKVELVNRMCNLRADCLCLQEVDRFNDLAHLMYQRGYTGYRVQDRDVAIFFKTDRFKVLKQETLHYKDHLWRSALMLKLQPVDGAAPFNLISTHITWQNKHDIEEMQQLRSFVLDHQEDPTIVCGDLNATPNSQALQALDIETLRDPLNNSSKKTYIDENRRLDYIFVPKGIHVHSANVDGNPAELKTKSEPSDHLPITTDLVFPSGLRTQNNQQPHSIGHALFEAFNEEMKFSEHTQEEYDDLASHFRALLSNNDLDAFYQKLDNPLLISAVHRYERSQLQDIASLLKKEQITQARSQLSQLSHPLRVQVHFCTYEIEKRNGRHITHPNFGEAAFYGRDGVDISNPIRLKAIERCLLREVSSLLESNQENKALDLFESLSADTFRNPIYGELYSAAQKRGIPTNHPDFGKAAFHRLENCDVPSDLRLEAVKSYLS